MCVMLLTYAFNLRLRHEATAEVLALIMMKMIFFEVTCLERLQGEINT